jgi:hypothetical protein
VLKPAHDRFLLDLITRQAVQAFDKQQGDATGKRVRKQRSTAWPVLNACGTAQGPIGVYGVDFDAERFSSKAANSRLIFDGRVGLLVRRKSGVDGCLHQGAPQWLHHSHIPLKRLALQGRRATGLAAKDRADWQWDATSYASALFLTDSHGIRDRLHVRRRRN